MTDIRFTFRLTADDVANVATIAETLRGRMTGPWVDRTQTVRAALTAAARLAREGNLGTVLAGAPTRG